MSRALAYARQPYAIGRIGDWWAEFAITADGPVRITPWYSATTPAEVARARAEGVPA